MFALNNQTVDICMVNFFLSLMTVSHKMNTHLKFIFEDLKFRFIFLAHLALLTKSIDYLTSEQRDNLSKCNVIQINLLIKNFF